MNYDVIIAGAGPAGAQCARYLAKNSKYSVLLLDKTQEIGEPKKSTAGTKKAILKQFELPKKIVQSDIDRVVFESPNEESVFSVDACVLDFGLLKKFLAEDAVHNGAVLQIQSSVTAPIVENKKVVGVQYDDFEGSHEARAKIVIDATGPSAFIASKLGLRKLDPASHWIGMEYEMENLDLKRQKSMVIKFDNNYAPGGYSWVFSTGKNHGKVGNCWGVDKFKKNGGSGSQVSYLKKWIRDDERLVHGEAMEVHAGDAYLNYQKQIVSNGFMCAGDSVCAIEPIFGEGIRWGLYSGMFAAQTAIGALKTNDFSSRQLSVLGEKWDSLKMSRRLACAVNRAFYRLPNSGFDSFVANTRKLDAAALERFMDCAFTLRDILKLMPIPGFK